MGKTNVPRLIVSMSAIFTLTIGYFISLSYYDKDIKINEVKQEKSILALKDNKDINYNQKEIKPIEEETIEPILIEDTIDSMGIENFSFKENKNGIENKDIDFLVKHKNEFIKQLISNKNYYIPAGDNHTEKDLDLGEDYYKRYNEQVENYKKTFQIQKELIDDYKTKTIGFFNLGKSENKTENKIFQIKSSEIKLDKNKKINYIKKGLIKYYIDVNILDSLNETNYYLNQKKYIFTTFEINKNEKYIYGITLKDNGTNIIINPGKLYYYEKLNKSFIDKAKNHFDVLYGDENNDWLKDYKIKKPSIVQKKSLFENEKTITKNKYFFNYYYYLLLELNDKEINSKIN